MNTESMISVKFQITLPSEFTAPAPSTPPTIGTPPAGVTVPVILDSMPSQSVGDLARCVYFTVTADDPRTPWMLSIGGVAPVPFLMLGLQGIIFRPLSQNETEFVDRFLIDEFIDAIENFDGFSVETEYFWLPTDLLDRAFQAEGGSEPNTNRGKIERGMVFRVGLDLFAEAYKAAADGTELHGFNKFALDRPVGANPGAAVRYSPKETQSFRAWSERQTLQSQNFRR